jgi:DNA-binding response OmpR family regulator
MTVSGTPKRVSSPLEGEDITTAHWEDARHWMSIYDDLLRFKRGLLARVERELPTLSPIARHAASEDLTIIQDQLEGYQTRLDLWYSRVWELKGLWLDPEGRLIRHQGRDAHLTKREYQLLKFLLDHPHRFFTADQIKDRAWAEPALFPEEVRNYVRRVRKILSEIDIPCDLINRPQKGYSLVFRSDT